MNMINFLKKSVKIKIIQSFDFYFSQFITKKNDILMLVAACISYENRNGHIFLPIEYFEKNHFFSNYNTKFIKKILSILGKKINWALELSKHSSVGNGSTPTPLVLFKKKIYLYKMWKSKENILKYLRENNKKNEINYTEYSKILDDLFSIKKNNFQKIAVALTLINRITFILGGPGTGKTTTILKIIIALIKTSKIPIKIQLSAPTGKATMRLTEILKQDLLDIYLNQEEKSYLPSSALTVHELLGIQKISQKSFFNKNNLLNLDVLIIDETSMIDILMMEKIFLATLKTTKIIFIGDHNQLCPIESGSILQDIYYYAKYGYSFKTLSILEKITNDVLLNKKNKKKSIFISDCISILKKNYRFHKNSGIYVLSNAICYGKKEIIKSAFNNSLKNVFFYETNHRLQYKNMINNIVFNNKNYWDKIHKKYNIKEIIENFQKYQVLCILRDSEFGVNIINQKIEEEMKKNNMIKNIYMHHKIWYVGRPIMITRNNKCLGLSNGDIGITNLNNEGLFQVSFLERKNIIKNIPISILNNYETAWAITVHKAQGSEFINSALILPNFYSHILNKDILYTAITRSRSILSIFSNKEIFMKAALKTIKRKNSLVEE